MSDWEIVYTRQALKDKKTAVQAGFGDRIREILATLGRDPFTEYPPYEKLCGDMGRAYSRRMSIQHRVVYEVYKKERVVKIISMWLHYE